jgi:hypothetical protein
VPDEIVAPLQHALLAAVLGRRPLPGSERPLMLPDLQFVLQGDAVVLADENLALQSPPADLPRAVVVLGADELRDRAQSEGSVAHLRFQPAEREGDSIRVTLEARIASADPGQGVLGLSGVQAKFVEIGGRWELAEEPAFFAA